MQWRDGYLGATGSAAFAGHHLIGHVGAMEVSEGNVLHGKWYWTLDIDRATSGHVATKARAKMAVIRAWRRWLDERGLVEQESALGMVREALAKAGAAS